MLTISIIVPVYNVESYLTRCIDSVLSQAYKEWELLLIDDGSVDNSGAICDQYAANESRIKVYHKVNGGVSSARNLGLFYAKGDWIMFLDSDDWLSEDCFDVCLTEVTTYDLDAVQFNHTIVYSDGNTEVKSKDSTLILAPEEYLYNGIFNVCAGGGLYRREIIVNNHIEFPIDLKLAEDQIFVLKVIKNSSRVRFINAPMYYYFQNDNSAVHNKKSLDMINSCYELIKFANTWRAAKMFTDSMCLVLILDIIRNGDLNYKVISELYREVNFYSISKQLPRSCSFFYNIAKICPWFAIRMMSIYFTIRHKITL